MSEPAAKNMAPLYVLLLLAAISIFYTSCTTVKNAPKNLPFVYETNINIEGKYSTEEQKSLKSQLEQQLHDSIRTRSQQKVLFWHTIKNPPVFDTLNVGKSRIYMSALLHSMGYYRDSIAADTTMKIVGDEYRTTVNFHVLPGKLFHLDSVWINLRDSAPASPRIDTLQALTMANKDETLLKKGDPFSQIGISNELDRLADVYRNNGYLRFSRDQLMAVWDTVGINLMRLTFDPQEQLQQLQELQRRKENPTADVEIRLRPDPDTARLLRYYVGTVRVYPDFTGDTSIYNSGQPNTEILGRSRYQFVYFRPLFKNRKLIRFISLRRGELYTQSNYLRTQNKFSALPAWKLVTINQIPRPDQDTVDFDIRLIPANKRRIGINLDVSRNDINRNQDNVGTEGNLLGLGTTLSLINRNQDKAANVATTNIRYGIEFASKLGSIQTQQFTVSHTIQFPRLVPNMRWIPFSAREDARTLLTINAGDIDRLNYYNVRSLNTSWTYVFSLKKMIVTLKLPNIEYNLLQRRQLMKQLIDSNRSYQYIFNDGLIASSIVNFTIVGGKKHVTNVTGIAFEHSGILTGIIKNIQPKVKLFRFIKLDAEFVQTRIIRRTAFAWRLFGGVGYGLPFSTPDGTPDSSNLFMPFFRQYYAGGPNSMRAWSVRKLGPGSSIKSFSRTSAPDRFGDVRLEGNAEYRFYISSLYGYPLEGALFTDIGNVWFLRKNDDFPNGEFRISRLWHDLAIGMGTGLRVDFGFLKARFDFAWKAKDPSPEDPSYQNKWFYKWRLGIGDKNGKQGAQFQLGINYPF